MYVCMYVCMCVCVCVCVCVCMYVCMYVCIYVEHAELKCALRKQDDSAVLTDVLNELKCSVCGCLLLSKAGLVNHLKSHGQ